MISLAVKDLVDLEQLMETLKEKKIGFVPFFEPDINEITAIVIEPSKEADKATSSIKLAGRKAGVIDKHK
jgi:hypothetical protein